MNEVRETLERAIHSPLELAFGNADEARLWVFRAHNHIRRHFPQGKQLMISRRREVVTLRVPTMTVRELGGDTRGSHNA